MAKSDTKNVKLGVCKIYLSGVDLGYTQGGVEFSVTTETHKTEVDQFGKTAISERITGRECKVTAPLAETTIDNLVAIMPGATKVTTGGSKASGTLTVGTNPTSNETVLVNGETVTFVSGTANKNDKEVKLGSTAALTAAALSKYLDESGDAQIGEAQYSVSGAAVTVTYNTEGTDGNAFTLAAGTSGLTVSAATLSGGTASTGARVDVSAAISTDLLELAQELRLHPKNLPDNDLSEDVFIPLAATAGAINFAYKVDEERTFPVEFMGYPDPETEILFSIGGSPV